MLFDLGDTVLNFGRVKTTGYFVQGARLSYAYLKEHGQPVGGFTWYLVRYLARLRTHYAASDFTGRDFNASAMLEHVGRKEGMRLTPEQWEQVAWLWYEPLSKVAQIEADLAETLAQLKKLGLKLGIVSNTFVSRASLEKHLGQLGVLDFFDMQMYSYEFTFRKPNLQIFSIAAERIEAARENVAFVGDRIDKDIRPALKSGMTAVLKDAYTNQGKPTPPGAQRIRHLAELPALIEKINAGAV